ncbi:MAG TPA: ABC transporter permease [Candidatus Bipolaricaulota bacterium]
MAQQLSTQGLGERAQAGGLQHRTYFRLFWSQLNQSPLAMGSLFILVALCLAAVLAPWISDVVAYDPKEPFVGGRNEGPSAAHWFGTDHLGRDLFSRVLWGSQISLSIGLMVALLSVGIGALLGAMSGFFGGKVDTLIMRFTDVWLNFPGIFFLIAIVTILEPSFWNLIWAIGILSWPSICRIVRANILSLKEREFILAARAIGAGGFRIIVRHLMPNTMAPVIVNATLTVAGAILSEAGLSYLGLGVQPPTPSWGNILFDGKPFLITGQNFWYTFFPGLFIFITVLCINFLGDGLRDALDPKVSTKR